MTEFASPAQIAALRRPTMAVASLDPLDGLELSLTLGYDGSARFSLSEGLDLHPYMQVTVGG